MRILTVTPWFPSGPGARDGSFIWHSVEALVEAGHRVAVLVTHPWRPKAAGWLHSDWKIRRAQTGWIGENIPVERIHHLSIPRNLGRPISNRLYIQRVAPAICSMAQSEGAELVHAHTDLAGAACIAAASRVKLPVVVTLHGLNTARRLRTPAQLRFVREALNAADRVILVGKPLLEDYTSVSEGVARFEVIPNGFKLPHNLPRLTSHPGDPLRIVSVSNLHEGKGIDLNILALAKLRDEGLAHWTYTIVGDGREREKLQHLTRSLGLSERVRFAGRCEWEDVFGYLADADVFALPSYREAFGIAYLEAMAMGLLTIGVRGQGPEAFIEDRLTGRLVEPRDVDSLAGALRECLSGQVQLNALAEAGQAHVMAEFSWTKHAERLSDLYARVLQERA